MSIPSQQKALLLQSKLGQFVVDTVPVSKPGSGEILVKVEAAALNPLDWKIQAYGLIVEKYPAILGFDGSGTVVEVGKDVTSFAVGDRVIVQGWYDAVKQSTHGTFLQYFVSPARFAAKIPASIPVEAAATVPSGIATAAFPLYNQLESAPSAKLLPPWVEGGRGKYAGKAFLVLAGATSMGQYVIQFARLSGFSPIVTTASLHNTDFLKSLGATHVLDRKLPADTLKAEATKIAGGLFECVYDAVSLPETLPVAYALTAPKGDLVVVAPTDEDALTAGDKESAKRIHMAHGLFASAVNHAVGGTLLAAVPELLESGDLKPNRAEILPGGLNGIVGGLERLKNDQVSGVKLVARPHETD
ncbi:GroES-like protein [Earliella scabrosa]|nr:GroES-like protein [Earliella scabrosa]